MLQLSTRKAPLGQRPTLRQSWELDAQTGKPVARWIIEETEPAVFQMASAA